MTAKEFQRLVTREQSDFLDRFLALRAERKIEDCATGGLAVNACTEPVVTLDCDGVLATSRLPELQQALRRICEVEEFEHSLNLTAPGSDVRIQIQTDLEMLGAKTQNDRAGTQAFRRRARRLDPVEGHRVSRTDAATKQARRETRVDTPRLVEMLPHPKDKLPSEIRNECKP